MYKLNMTILLAIVMMTVSCQTKDSKKEASVELKTEEETSNMNIEEQAESLGALLEEKKQAFIQKAPEEVQIAYQAGLDAVANSGILEQAMNLGDKAPDFTLINQKGESVHLYDELKKGPVVLTWYRGGWCPYCNLTLAFLQKNLPEFQNLGASLIALTPELPDNSMSTSEKHALDFEVQSDVGNVIAKNYGIVFKLLPEVADRYQKGFDMHSYNGDESDELPLAATYVINQEGIIKYAFLDADYRNRAEPSKIIEALELLK